MSHAALFLRSNDQLLIDVQQEGSDRAVGLSIGLHLFLHLFQVRPEQRVLLQGADPAAESEHGQ